MAINMLKKIDQRATNVRKPLNLIILIFAITSTRYGVLMLFKPDGGTLASHFKDFFYFMAYAIFDCFFIKPFSSYRKLVCLI